MDATVSLFIQKHQDQWQSETQLAAINQQARLQVVYATVVLPYIIVVVLLVRFLTLPGSLDGLYHFFWPRFEVLRDLRVCRGDLKMTKRLVHDCRCGAMQPSKSSIRSPHAPAV